jgi:glyceraldehyde 3-phosphate dehydrogenase
MAVKVGINGFGRIGRNVVRAGLHNPNVEFVAVNDITDTKTLAYLLKYDSVLGMLPETVTAEADAIRVGDKLIKVFATKDTGELNWTSVGAQIVVESTGFFTDAKDACKHLRGSVKKVIISAPAKIEDITGVMGVNDNLYDPEKHHIISNASCTTNCLAPIVKVLHDTFGIKKGSMTTIHSYTNDQNILDLPHKDLRRARAAALSQIPTTTGAAKATALVIPEVKGKIDGIAIRVPTPDVSFTDLVVEVERATSIEAVNDAFRRAAANGPLKGILDVSDEELVSCDYIGNPFSCILDAKSTNVIDGTLVKVCGWYDNEWGYSSRCVDLLRYIGKTL